MAADKYGMISIKKLIERSGEELFRETLNSYRAALNAIGESGVQACPPVGSTLRQNLLRLEAAIATTSNASLLQETGQKVEAEIAQWGSGAADYFKERAGEVKELMLILARAAELTGERDRRYSHQFQEFTGRLEAMADLHDLAVIRDSLMKSALDLRSWVEAMAEESQKSVARLRGGRGGVSGPPGRRRTARITGPADGAIQPAARGIRHRVPHRGEGEVLGPDLGFERFQAA